MNKTKKMACILAAVSSATLAVSCMRDMDDGNKITVWISEGDRALTMQIAEEFKAKYPDKNYKIVVDIQGINDVATRVLNDVENAADVYAYSNDQLPKLVSGDALAQIAGERLERVKQANSADSIASATISVNNQEGVYGMPYTDNTFFLYYDKSVLSETDVQSIDGILSKCTDGKKFAFPMQDGWYTTSFYFGKDLGYEVEYDASRAETKITCNFDNATGEKVTQAMWELVKDPRVKADADDSKITAGFHDKSIVAAVSGIWNKTQIQEYLGENFAATKLPTYTYGKGTSEEAQVQLTAFAGYKLMGVNNYSKNKTAAMDFAEFFSNRENQVKRFEVCGFVPTDETARQDPKVQADICAQAITAQLQYSKTQKDVPSTMWNAMKGLGAAMITGAASGNFSVAEQLKACVDAIEKNSNN